ncbi:putative leucine-rich repeat-containing, plant-type, leucine-rich repeat domain superfamily [Helianthus annuus]|nr:putative leucine-rich repeat-containing, plant-type, leucine-rich repeat domain superfamily [Helianthus annuus]
MSAQFSVSYFSSCNLCLLIFLVLLCLCLSDQKSDDVLCMDGERQALLEFKHNLIDEADRLASWDAENNDCCRWAGIVCDNITGHVHEIRLRGLDGRCDRPYSSSYKVLMESLKQMLRGNLSSSLLELKQLKYLDLSCNDFEEIQIPSFIGSLRNLRYLNLSESKIGGIIPPQIGNLSELRVLSLGSFYGIYGDPQGTLTSRNIQWLSSLRWLHHLDMSSTNLSEATDWFQVINALPSLVQLHMSRCGLRNAYSHVPSLNVTSLSLLDLSNNYLYNTSVPRWIFSLKNLVSLDLTSCNFDGPLPSIYSFRNLTSLESVHVRRNDFMNSPSVLKGFSSNLMSLDLSACGLSSSALDSLHNLTSLLSLDLSYNQLTKAIPNSFGNLCRLREIDLSLNNFSNISLAYLLQSLFECKSPSLESLSIIDSGLSGPIPYSIGRLSSLKRLRLYSNRLNGSIPDSIGRLSSLEQLDIQNNQLSGNLPNSLGQLSNLNEIWFSFNLLTGVLTEAHFSKLVNLTYINGEGNKLTLKVKAANWIPPFQAQILYLNSWSLGPEFPLWLQSQRDLLQLDISNTGISSIIPPESFWRSLPNLTHLDMSQNHIKGTLILGIPASLRMLKLSSNEFRGGLPYLSNGSLTLAHLDLSNNFFEGTINHFICSNGVKETQNLILANNFLSGVIPECWDKWPNLQVLNLENNALSGELPRMGSLMRLHWLNMQGNKISGRIPYSLMNLSSLSILQLGQNELVGSIPAWFGTKLTLLRIVSLRHNNLEGNIPHELCHLSLTQILDLAHNNLSGNIPRCFNNFSIISGKETVPDLQFYFITPQGGSTQGSASLVMKGREDRYTGSIGLVMLLDLSVNKFSGQIPIELTTLLKLKSLNLSRNQLIGRIPDKIGDLRALETLDLSVNKLSGELPVSLSAIYSLSNFNVSYNNLTGRIPVSTQLQSFIESSFIHNKLCGPPLIEPCKNVDTREHQKEDAASNGVDWDLIISIVLGFIVGFWIVVGPLIVNKSWSVAYFGFWSELYDVMHKYFFNMFCK